jgi:hypothetical protein
MRGALSQAQRERHGLIVIVTSLRPLYLDVLLVAVVGSELGKKTSHVFQFESSIAVIS